MHCREYFADFFLSSFAIISKPGFLWPGCMCKRSEAFWDEARKEGRGSGLHIVRSART
jgi:hypothetical protein